MFLQETDLNVVPGGIIPVMHVSQYDVGRELKFVLYDGYDTADITTGMTVTIEGTKPDGHGFQYSGVLDQSTHTATFVTTEQMTVLAGAIECKLTLYLNSQRIGTALFILDVEKAGINYSTIISDTELPLIIAQATEQMERAEAAADAAALSETNAATSETNAAASEASAANSEIVCGSFMRMAGVSAASAEQSAIISGSFMRTAGNYADGAEASAASANVNALKSEGHALGTQNGTPVSSDSPYYHNNAKYWADEARQSSAGGVAASVIATAEPTNISTHAYAIGDQFVYNGILYTATSAISVGATITPGTNCSISDTITEQIGNAGKVTGVKGNAESGYRTGNVNISPADIGLEDVDNTSDADKPVSTATQAALNGKVSTDGASTNTTVAFTSNDLAANTTAKTSNTTNQPSTVAKLGSGETLASLFGKISSMFASIRKLWNTVGFETAQISKVVGDTSVTFSNSAIMTTSELTLLSENSSNTPIFYTAVTVSDGSATYTFPALTVATKFSLKVR